jgi:2-polyprenyl-3-methyl-5-hydroxy-6-metoxy-1,4-benzoquinol methylase
LPSNRFLESLAGIRLIEVALKPLLKKVELSIMCLDGQEIGGRLLDVGCATGDFLVRMRELGWDVYGVDIDSNAVKIARDHNRLDVFDGTLEQACFPDDAFDAVTMSHVIEHVADPLQILKETYRILKPGGKLVLTTPNMHSLCHKIYKSSYYHLDIPRHFYILSTKSIRICAESARLKILRLGTFARSVSSTLQASREIKKNGMINGYYTGKRKGFYPNIIGYLLQGLENRVSSLIDIGEEIVLIATKEKSHNV